MTPPFVATGTAPSRPRRGRFAGWAAWVVAAASLVLAVALGSRFGSDPGLSDSPLIGRPAPVVTLPSLRGDGDISLENYLGQIVVVNFWASWCVPCRSEHDSLLSTASAFENSGVQFVGIVYQDEPDAAREFLDELGWGEDYEYVTDPGSRAAIGFGLFGVPETFFIDERGVVVSKITGESDSVLLGTTLDRILRGETPGQQTTGTIQVGPG